MEGEEFVKTVQEAIESEPLKDLNLKLVGVGCEKIVFETPGSQRKVIKVNIDEVVFRVALKLGLTTEEQSGNSQLKDLIAERKEIETDLIDVFGVEHVLRNGVFRGKIPFSRDILIKLTDKIPVIQKRIVDLPEDSVFEVEALIETQIMANELKDQVKFKTKSLSIDLVTDDSFRGVKNVTSGMSLIRRFVNKHFLADFQKDSSNLEYVEKVKEILIKIIQFTKRTGLMVDIFGPNNLTIFTNEDGKLDYHLLDVILPGPRGLWDKNIKDDPNFDLLRHNYQFYYAVKSLGDKLGIADNLEAEDMVYFKGYGIPTKGRFPER
jgi:hypothetical protein